MTSLRPWARILLYIVLVITVFVFHSFTVNLLLLGIILLFAVKVPLSTFKRGIIPVSLFLFFTFTSNVLFQEGTVVYEIFGLSITHEGLARGGRLTLRLFILILGAKVLTATTPAEDLVNGMKVLLGPVGRLNYVQEVVSTMSLTLRLLPVIYNEAVDLYREVRAGDDTGLRDKLRLAVEFLTMLFERSMKKAKEMSEEG